MRILILNWKDICHPHAGGAEKVTAAIAQGLVKLGYQVTLFTSRPRGLPAEEIRQGVTIVRRGNFWTVYLWAFIYYLFRFHQSTDLIVDQIHGIPFFARVYSRKPVVAYIHEVADRIWFYEYPLLLALVGWCVERLYFVIYRNCNFITVTASTARDLRLHGVPAKQITIIPSVVKMRYQTRLTKSKHPTLIYIGRISAMKRIELLLEGVREILPQFPLLKVRIVGAGKSGHSKRLRRIIVKLRLTSIVKFYGFISEGEKHYLLSSSWLNVHPSLKEGYGLTVVEAAAVATPTIGYAVPGLIDLVQPQKTGWIVKNQTASALAQTLRLVLKDKRLLTRVSRNATVWVARLPTLSDQTHRWEKLLLRVYRKASVNIRLSSR